jgi:hypothetical protein
MPKGGEKTSIPFAVIKFRMSPDSFLLMHIFQKSTLLVGM